MMVAIKHFLQTLDNCLIFASGSGISDAVLVVVVELMEISMCRQFTWI